MSIDKSYLELALGNIQDGQSKEKIVSFINETLKQAATDTKDVSANSEGKFTIPQSTNPMVTFISSVENCVDFKSSKQGKELAKDYVKEVLKFAMAQHADGSVIEDLNDFIKMFD